MKNLLSKSAPLSGTEKMSVLASRVQLEREPKRRATKKPTTKTLGGSIICGCIRKQIAVRGKREKNSKMKNKNNERTKKNKKEKKNVYNLHVKYLLLWPAANLVTSAPHCLSCLTWPWPDHHVPAVRVDQASNRLQLTVSVSDGKCVEQRRRR